MDNGCTPVLPERPLAESYSLASLACVLTGEPARAEVLLREALTSGHATFGSGGTVVALDVARELARRVYLAWRDSTDEVPAPVATRSGGFSGLTEEQRSVVALCAYGAHTYSQAALVLGTATRSVVELMQDALGRLEVDLSDPHQAKASMAQTDLIQDVPVA